MLNNKCWNCGKNHDSHVTHDGDDDHQPEDGDVGLCFGCGEWMVFDFSTGGNPTRKPNDEEFEAIAMTPECRASREAFLKMKDYYNKIEGPGGFNEWKKGYENVG